MARKHKGKGREDVATQNFNEAISTLFQHPIFVPLLTHAHPVRVEKNLCPPDGWAVVTTNGFIHVHPTRRADPQEWVYVIAHCLLHLGFGQVQARERQIEWNAACDCIVARFLADLRMGRPPEGSRGSLEMPARTEERLYAIFCEQGIPASLQGLGVGGAGGLDMLYAPADTRTYTGLAFDWQECFASGLVNAVAGAVRVAAGVQHDLQGRSPAVTAAERARQWFMSSYPLLGALAAAFKIVEDPRICQQWSISVAAVDAEVQEIYMNPAAGLDEMECRFVMAHELLHVGLRHQARCQGRDPYLWNVACDYVINGWLVEMGVGDLPQLGVLYDPALKGESAEAIYDRIILDRKRCQGLRTLRGTGLGDMLDKRPAGWWDSTSAIDLDEFYRRCMGQGLSYHEQSGRGFLPAGLLQEIRALSQPPIPWDVELAQWFDHHFPPVEKRRTYARPSRRQSATPDIPRPQYYVPVEALEGRTFGVVLDTSGSMDTAVLGRALGAIASYSLSRDVPAARVVFCDAAAYDAGYMPPEEIAGRVRVKGRGGTVLQPGIDLLERAKDFPEKGPLLIITDGYCDRLRVHRDHAYLMPHGHHLPFIPRGPVFRIQK